MDLAPRQVEPLSRHVALLGLRASGKSTAGAIVAARVGAGLIDLDLRTLAALRVAHGSAAGATVAAAWASAGEAAFRAAEAAALRVALLEPPAVIALGGGTPTAPGAEATLRSARDEGRATLIYLRADAATLRERLRLEAARRGGADPGRPSLTGADPIDEVERVFGARDPLYTALAQHVVDACQTPEACAERIVGLLRRP